MELLYTAGRNAKWYSHFEKQFGYFLKTYPSYKKAIPLLGIYSREMKTYVYKKTEECYLHYA